MERGSMEKLKFDKRLARRRGWVEESDLTTHVDGLPDVSDKRWLEERDGEQSGAAADADADPAPSTPEAEATSVSESTPPPTREF